MTGRLRDIVTRVQRSVPLAKATHYSIHRERLAVKFLYTSLERVLDEVVKISILIIVKVLTTRLFSALCEEMGSEHTKLLYHIEITWLTRGQLLFRTSCKQSSSMTVMTSIIACIAHKVCMPI